MENLLLLIANNKFITIAVFSAVVVFTLFIRRIYKSYKYHLKALKALGFYQDEIVEIQNKKTGLKTQRVNSKIKVYWKGSMLIFSQYNLAYSVKDFERLKPNLEGLFNISINRISYKKQWFSSQPKIILNAEQLPKKILISQRPKLNIGQIFLGIDIFKKPVILDTIKKFENTLLILAPKGSGKSILINSIIIAFFDTLIKLRKGNSYELIVADNKGTDFIGVIEKYKGSYYQPFDLQSLKNLVSKLKTHKHQIEITLKKLKERKISPRHWDELRDKNFDFDIPPKLFIILDEMKGYFGSGKQAPKLSKPPTHEELELLEHYNLIQEFGRLINYFAEQCRSTGIIIICASQSPNKTDYDYPDFINFPILVLGQANAQQSQQLLGNSSLNDNTLTRGVFIIRDEYEQRKFLSPLSINIKD